MTYYRERLAREKGHLLEKRHLLKNEVFKRSTTLRKELKKKVLVIEMGVYLKVADTQRQY